MYKPPFTLFSRKGVTLWPNTTQAPPTVRFTVRAAQPWLAANPALAAATEQQLIGRSLATIHSFVEAQRRAYMAGITPYHTRAFEIPYVRVTYVNNDGLEHVRIELDVETFAKGQKLPIGQTWLVGTDDTSLPFRWNLINFIDLNDACDELRFFPRPNFATGSPCGSGIFAEPIKDRMYWEVEVVTLQAERPKDLSKNVGGVNDCEFTESPISFNDGVTQTRKWPSDFDVFLQPVIGVVPESMMPDNWKTFKDKRVETTERLIYTAGDYASGSERPITLSLTLLKQGVFQNHAWSNANYYWESDDGTQRVSLAGANPWLEYNPCVGPSTAPYGVAFFGQTLGMHGTIIHRPHVFAAGSTGYFNPGCGTPIFDGAHFGALDGHYDPPGPSFSRGDWQAAAAANPSVFATHAYPCGNAEWLEPWLVGDVQFRNSGGAIDASGKPGTIKYRAGAFGDSFSDIIYGFKWRPEGDNPAKLGRHVYVVKGFYEGLPSGPPEQGTPILDPEPMISAWTGAEFEDLVEGDIVRIAVDARKGQRKLWFGVNKTWFDNVTPSDDAQPCGFLDGADNDETTYYAGASYLVGRCWVKFRFGAACKYPPPAGFDYLGGADIEIDA